MSALGHKQTFAGSKRKSALPPKRTSGVPDQALASCSTDIIGS